MMHRFAWVALFGLIATMVLGQEPVFEAASVKLDVIVVDHADKIPTEN